MGLFSYIDNAAIQNVVLENIDVFGEDSVGGLVGYAYESSITSSYSAGAVSCVNDFVGGLVGHASDNTSITSSYSKGSVSGRNGVGGLVGYARDNSNITNSFSMSAVSGNDNIGGLVGFTRNSDIMHCYSTGSVSSAYDFVGGLVGASYEDSSITSCYWDIETSGQTVSASGTGKTTVEMMQQATFVGWDFTTVWGICEDVYYPYLRLHYDVNKVIVSIETSTVPVADLPVIFNVSFHLPVIGFDSTAVDFSGGSMIQYQAAKEFSLDGVRAALREILPE